MALKKNYDTVSEATTDLIKRGYTTDFSIQAEKDFLFYNNNSQQLSPEEFKIDETHRFEGNTDPGDEMVVYAISCKINSLKGIVINAFGIYSDTNTSKIIERLKKR